MKTMIRTPFRLDLDETLQQTVWIKERMQWSRDVSERIPRGGFVRLAFRAPDGKAMEFLWCKVLRPVDVQKGEYLGEIAASALGSLPHRIGDRVAFDKHAVLNMEVGHLDEIQRALDGHETEAISL